MVKIATLTFILLAVAGCATPVETVPPLLPPSPIEVWCEHNQPRRPSPETIAAMMAAEKREAVEHNRKGALWCGWEA